MEPQRQRLVKWILERAGVGNQQRTCLGRSAGLQIGLRSRQREVCSASPFSGELGCPCEKGSGRREPAA